MSVHPVSCTSVLDWADSGAVGPNKKSMGSGNNFGPVILLCLPINLGLTSWIEWIHFHFEPITSFVSKEKK